MSNEKESIKKELFSTSSEKYGDLYQEHLINQYKLYVEIANNTSNMRASANTYFLTINSAIIAITGLLTQIINCPLHISIMWFIFISIFGAILSIAWKLIIQSYSNLNAGRYFIIHLLEEKLPAKLFQAEWNYLYPSNGIKKYMPLTNIEKYVPILFVLIYILLIFLNLYLYFN